MSNRNDGGPAFSCAENSAAHTIAMAAMLELPATASTDEKDKAYITAKAKVMQGMSLRDYFAAKAMQGICAHHDTWSLTGPEISDHAYRIAESMLAARGES
ncbi:hypothetical protein [Pseudomonas chlororaphis]|uniref:hypothetical protein n=1 Tax=Pseudomonas chlororaphis TaxID=587753 RepID=UPI00117B18B8|nr:hypothetical protein [Pseudomonas chlororaphis]